MASKQRTLHHVSFHFAKSRVLFSVPSTTYVPERVIAPSRQRDELADAWSVFFFSFPFSALGVVDRLLSLWKSRFWLALRTLLDLKRTLLTALPMLHTSSDDAPSPPPTSPLTNVRGTSDIVLWRRRGVEGMDRFGSEAEEQGPEGWVCLEGDPESFGEAPGEEEQGERRRVLDVTIGDQGRIPAWDRWVDVYVSFRDSGGSWPEPVVQHPSLDDEEYVEDA